MLTMVAHMRPGPGCVYSAYSGRVTRVEMNLAATGGNVTIDHHPRGLGFVTNYKHITDIQVGEGDFVHEGEPFAKVSALPETPPCTSSSGR
jgi:murein DD-endopeptidase MepM/ murein hydrolase activator NlpD